MKSWPLVELRDCCEVVSGATPSTSRPDYWGGDVLWVTPKELSKLEGMRIGETERRLTSAGLASCAARTLPVGAVLLSSRAPIGLVALTTAPMATNQGFKSLVPDMERLVPEYLYFWLRANRERLQAMGNGATFKELSKAGVERLRIALPPVSVQRRVAEVLEVADTLRAKRRAAMELYRGLRDAEFLEMFGDPSKNPKGWPVQAIGTLLESATYGSSQKAGAAGAFPILRMNNITSTGEMDLGALKYVDLPPGRRDRFLVRDGDVLFNRTNSMDLVGKSAVFHGTEPMAYAGYLIRLRCKPALEPEYLGAFLNTAYAKRVLRSMCKSIIGMANINAREIQTMLIPVPPLAFQRRFAEKVGTVSEARSKQIQSAQSLDALFASLQHRAFNGTLFAEAAPSRQ